MTPPNPHHEYLASRVAAATPMELTRMLFEGAVKAVEEALVAHRAGDILARGNGVTRGVQILGELRFSLRRDVAPQYCDTLSGLYGYLQNRLIQAHAEKSEPMLQEVLRLIQTLLEGWVGAMRNVGDVEMAPSQDPQRAEPQPVAAANAASPYSSSLYPSTAATGTENLNRSWEF
jgi:flagellar secretion chaperone FliS